MKIVLIILSVLSFYQFSYAKSRYKTLPPLNIEFKNEIDKLTKGHEYQQALKRTEAYIKASKLNKNDIEYARGLIQKVQLQLGLHGYETAVRDLKSAALPKDPMAKSLVELYYAYALMRYYQSYSWEINKRERVVSTKEVDLKKWTKDQISEEINKTFSSLWRERLQLSHFKSREFSEFFNVNSYPDRIRGYLRDALTYLWAQHLNNSQYWTPEQSNSVYMLPQKKVLVGNTKNKKHPLAKATFILQDLASWHDSARRKEAALEAKLEIYRHVSNHYTSDNDKKILLGHLRRMITTAPKKAWKAMAYAELVKFLKKQSEADALIRARKMALTCTKSFPESVGARFCTSYLKQIEAPSYSFQSMFIDGKKRRSLELNYKNLEKIYLFAYKRPLKQLLVGKKDYNLFPNQGELQKIITTPPTKQWEVSLKKTKDYRQHKKFLELDLSKNGYYVIVASAEKNPRQKSNNKIVALNYVQSNYVIKKERMKTGGWRFYVVTGDKGEAVSKANLKLYKQDYKQGFSVVRSDFTNDKGGVEFNSLTPRFSYYATAEKEGEITLEKNNIHFGSMGREGRNKRSVLYTDRSVYRPGQKIMFKILGYQNTLKNLDQFEVLPENTLATIVLSDANYKNVNKLQLKLNKYGTASGEFLIPKGRLLGQWQLRARISGAIDGHSYLQVEEYKRPTFEVSLDQPEKALRLNRKAHLSGDVKYYHGMPVTGGSLKWKIYRSARFPWWWSWYYWGSSRSSNSEQMIASGVEKLKKTGKFDLLFTPDADEHLKESGVVYNYRVMVDITDLGGETRSAEKNFQIGFVDVRANLVAEKNYFTTGVAPEFKVHLSSLNGKPLEGKGKWRLYAVKQPQKTRPLSEETRF